MKKDFHFAFGLLAVFWGLSLPAGVFTVKPGDSIEAALRAARKSAGASNEIVLASGHYYLPKTLELNAADSNLVLRAAEPGKAILFGGRRLTGWRQDGGPLWAVDLPDVKAGKLDFRVLVVNGRLAERATWPGGTNTLENLGQWNVRMLSALAGWWERMPTREELCTMPYRPGDLPAGFDCRNAEVRCYHMWSDSLLRVLSNDTRRAVLTFAFPAAWPAGAVNKRSYVVYNIREGLKAPGQWYLDRTAGKVVYWPLPGEDVHKSVIVAPGLQRVVRITGSAKNPVRNLTVSGLGIQASTPPFGRSGFGARDAVPAFAAHHLTGCTLEKLDVRNVGGVGLSLVAFSRSRLTDAQFTDIGACAVRFYGTDSEMARCRILRTGRLYASACGVNMVGTGLKLTQCEIADTPYSGVIMGGKGHFVADNLVQRVMRVMHDGAAFYGNITDCTVRGNVVRDVVEYGKGFGASAFYVDEGGENNVFERNVAEGVPMPVHHHITRNTRVVDNVFMTQGDMMISFQNSIGCTFENNTLVVGGKLNMRAPYAVATWENNRVFRPNKAGQPSAGWYIGDGKPDNPPEKPQRIFSAGALTNGAPPVFDGELKANEWAGDMGALRRDATRRSMGGAPTHIRSCYDATNVYFLVQVTAFREAKYTKGHEWGVDDGVEIALGPLVLRGFIDGTLTCSDPALEKHVRGYAGMAKKNRGMGQLSLYAFAVPRSALAPYADKKGIVPFNARVFIPQYNETRYYEAPSAEVYTTGRFRLPK